MGTVSADYRGFADWNHDPSTGTIRVISMQPKYDFGNKNIDTQTTSVLYRGDVVALHNAAVQGQSAFETEAAARMGSWWSSVVAACDNAGCQGVDHVKVIAMKYHRGPIDLP